MLKPIRFAAWILLLIGSIAGADIVQTKTGEIFKGRVVEQTEEYVKLRSQFGELTIPNDKLKSHNKVTYTITLKDGTTVEGQIVGDTGETVLVKVGQETQTLAGDTIQKIEEKTPATLPKKPKPLTPKQIQQHHLKGMEYFKQKNYQKALAEFQAILKTDPENSVALYNSACAHSLMKDEANALKMLVAAIESGWVNFEHMQQDTDLDNIRESEGYKAILAKKAEYIRQSTEKTVARITDGMKQAGVNIKKYRSLFDQDRNFIYLHTRPDEALAVIRKGLEDYAEYQWKHLFQNRPARPLYIVLLDAEDSAKVFKGRIGGLYQPAFNTLFCGDIPSQKLTRTSVVVHEFTHALHFADMSARQQMHPIWLIEGLATLFESSDRNGGVVPRHSYRLSVVQAAVRANQAIPWRTLMAMQHPTFMQRAHLAYAQSRYMLYYMYEKGLLKKFYDEYTDKDNFASDKNALTAFEVVFGKPIEAVQREWAQWVMQQKVPPIPFLGIGVGKKGEQVVINQVAPRSPAAKAGIKKGDLLVSINERPIRDPSGMMEAVGLCDPGDEIALAVKRGDEALELKTKLGARPMRIVRRPPKGPGTPGYLGLAVEEAEEKLIIKDVAKGSPAEKAGLSVGDEILAFNGKEVKTVREYLAELRKTAPGKLVRLKRRIQVQVEPQAAPEGEAEVKPEAEAETEAKVELKTKVEEVRVRLQVQPKK
jgi:C-terminal processing protease CtpA/Prc